MPTHIPPEVIDTAQAAGSALGPAAIGAAVSQAYKRGLTYGERLIQVMVGICVSYFATLAIAAIFAPSLLLAQAITFALGTVAYEATPRFIARATDAIAELPGRIADKIIPTKDDK